MYEAPKLNYVGKARDVVLGYPGMGTDLDAFAIVPEMEFFEDPELPATDE
jgi:hypothetical protein